MTIVILDDHPLILNAIEIEIKDLFPNIDVHLFTTIEETRIFLNSNITNFVICDLKIISGKSLIIPELCFNTNVPCMVYSSYTSKIILIKLRELNVSVFVSKSSSTSEFKAGLRALLNGEKYYCSILTEVENSDIKVLNTNPILASKSQFNILSLLNSGFTQTQVANKLNVSERTIINHLAILRNKNNCYSTIELLRRYEFWL